MFWSTPPPERLSVPATAALIEAAESVLVFSTLMSLEIDPDCWMVIDCSVPRLGLNWLNRPGAEIPPVCWLTKLIDWLALVGTQRSSRASMCRLLDRLRVLPRERAGFDREKNE